MNYNEFFREGCEELLNSSKYFYLAILGSRNILPYTQDTLFELFEEISNFPHIVIVSGGMYGVDIFSQNLALKYNLGCISFLPCGIDVYKRSFLYKSVNVKPNSKFLMVSKFNYDFQSRKYSYLERNKQIIDFSDVILIAQSGLKSGSYFSGNRALEVSKKTFCIPISLNNGKFSGNNYLISKGADVYLSPLEFLKKIGFDKYKGIDKEEILKLLPISKDNLIKNFSDTEVGVVENLLLELILKGEIFYENGVISKLEGDS